MNMFNIFKLGKIVMSRLKTMRNSYKNGMNKKFRSIKLFKS